MYSVNVSASSLNCLVKEALFPYCRLKNRRYFTDLDRVYWLSARWIINWHCSHGSSALCALDAVLARRVLSYSVLTEDTGVAKS